MQDKFHGRVLHYVVQSFYHCAAANTKAKLLHHVNGQATSIPLSDKMQNLPPVILSMLGLKRVPHQNLP